MRVGVGIAVAVVALLVAALLSLALGANALSPRLVLDTLARLELVARRFGATIRLRNAGDALVELIAWAGLADVLEVEQSGVEMDRQVEEGEELGVDEEVHRGDGAV